MGASEQKSCLMCGTKKPIEAFRSKNGKITAICLQCLEAEDTGDQGGGGFQVDIVDKLAAVALKQEQLKIEAAANFEAITDRLDTQTEHLHKQDSQTKHSAQGLFSHERKTGNISKTTTDHKTSQQQSTEFTNNKADNKQKGGQGESRHSAKTTQQQNTLFSNNTKQHTSTTIAQQNPTTPDKHTTPTAAGKTQAASARGSSLFTTVPNAQTLDQASGKTPATNSELNQLATQFIENILRGPGRR